MFARLRQSATLALTAAALVGIVAGLAILIAARPQIGLMVVTIGTCFLGFIHRRLAWACALIAGAGLALVCLAPQLAGATVQYSLRMVAWIALIGLALAFLGGYLGALASWVLVPKHGRGG